MTTCEIPATHQIAEGGLPLCPEHASQAKREGALVEIRPAPGSGTGRRAQPSTCKYVESEETSVEPAPNQGEELDS